MTFYVLSMTGYSNDAQNMKDEFTDLETKCPYCNGKGGAHDRDSEREDGWLDCFNCKGSGFVPTEAGVRILALIRHNSRVKISAELTVSGAPS